MARQKKKPLESEAETYDCALNLLSFRDHSQKELKQKLKLRGASQENIQESIEKLTDYGILDDERYAQRVYEAWLAKRVYGRLHLVAELAKKGVPTQFAQNILEQFTDDEEQARAELAAEQFCRLNLKKIQQAKESTDPKVKQKISAAAARYMAARGFNSEYMYIALDKVQKL